MTTQPRSCIVCGRDLDEGDEQTCVRCLGRARRYLMDIEEFYALLPGEIVGRAGAASPTDSNGPMGAFEPALPGGDALVLLAGGSTKTRPSSDGDRSHFADEEGIYVPSALGVLASWEDDWRDVLGDDPGPKATMTGVLGYLRPRLTWAAQHHPAFDEFAHELSNLRQAMARALREDDPHDKAAVTCPESGCGGDLWRPYADPDPCPPGCDHKGSGHDQGGRVDWVCRDCCRTVTEASYWLLVRAEYDAQREQREAAS